MRWGRDGYSVKAAWKKGRPIPEDHWYYQRRELPPGLEMFQEAYRDLSTCRPPGGPIPWTACMEWADRRGLSGDIAGVLWGVVWRVDVAERDWRSEDLKREAGGA